MEMISYKKAFILTLIIVMVLVTGCSGKKETTANSSGAEVKAFDMSQLSELEAAAKKEGKIIWYAAMNGKDMSTMAKKFMEKYPEIKVETLSLTIDEFPARVATELKGGVHNVDMLSGSGWPMDQAIRQGAVEPFVLPKEITSQMADGSYDPKGYWASQWLLTLPIVYNAQKLKEEGLEVPKSFDDLTKPEWKGKIALNQIDYEWYAALKGVLGEEKAKTIVKGLGENKPRLTNGSSVTTELLISGEFTATVAIYGFRAEEAKKAGKPIDYVNVEPLITLLQPAGVAKDAPHPNAAKLFQLWTFTQETQGDIMKTFGRSSSRKDITNDPKIWDLTRMKYYINDPATSKDYVQYRDEYQKFLGIGK